MMDADRAARSIATWTWRYETASSAKLRCNGVFLAREIDRPSLVAELEPKDGIEEVVYVKGTLLWAAKVASLTKSSMVKLSRRPEYKQMTVRNLNTTLKLRNLIRGS